MCSFFISEPVTTDKTTYVSCQSKSPTNHRSNFFNSFIGFVNGETTDTFFLRCGGFSVSLTAKPPILCMKNFGNAKKVSVVLPLTKPINDSKNSIGGFSVTSTDNSHRWFDRLLPFH